MAGKRSAGSVTDYETLAAFRYSLRKFLHVAEEIARTAGLTPQQHQALLVIKGGYPGQTCVTISQLAEGLRLKNHSTVELVGRLVNAGLAVREPSATDRRQVLVSISPRGESVLASLSAASLEELRQAMPQLSKLLRRLADAGFGDADDQT